MDEVILATYTEPAKAHLARLQLESHGVDAWIDNENFAAVYPLPASFAGGVQLKVWEEDAGAAARVMEEIDGAPGLPRDVCPQCGLEQVGHANRSVAWMALMTLLTCGMYLPIWYKTHECGDCGHRWS